MTTWRIETHPGGRRQHGLDLDTLRRRGIAIPHCHHSWPRHDSRADWLWCRVLDADDGLVSGFAVELHNSRALPGMRIARIRRFGRRLHEPLLADTGRLLLDASHRIPRLLRLDVEVFDEDEQRRQRCLQALRKAGWGAAPADLDYRETLRLDLHGNDERLLERFDRRTRRSIRRTLRNPVLRFGSITTDLYRQRLLTLHRASFERSGGDPPRLDTAAMLADAAGRRHSILLGCFDIRRRAPDDLIAFAWIKSQGDHACYADAGSVRCDTPGAPGAAIMYEAIRWAGERGFDWFDFGGISDDERLAGISRFKAGFNGQRITVAESLSHTPSALLHGLAATTRWLSSGFCTSPGTA